MMDPTELDARRKRLVDFLKSLEPEEFLQHSYAVPTSGDVEGIDNIPRRDCPHCVVGWIRYHFVEEEKQERDELFEERMAFRHYGLAVPPDVLIRANDGIKGPAAAVLLIEKALIDDISHV